MLKRDFRLELIHQCLLNNMRSWSLLKLHKKVCDELLANGFKEVTTKTIYNDIIYLIEIKQAPIDIRKVGKDVFYYYKDTFDLSKPIITTDENFSLVMANQILQQLKGFTLSEDLNKITKKLQRQADESKNEVIISFEEQPSQNIHLLQGLFECIKDKTVIKVDYKSFYKAEVIEKIIHPYLLKQYNKRWYLFGLDEKHKRIDNSPLDRIVTFKPTSSYYNDSHRKELDTYFDDIIGVTRLVNAKPEDINIRIKKERASYVITKPIHRSQKIVNQNENGDVEISLKLIFNKELVSQLLSFGKDIEIIHPQSLKELLLESCFRG